MVDVEQMREKMPWRACVGIMVLNGDGKVWAGRRIEKPNSEYAVAKLWQMPQGGIDKGEKPIVAALRELFEETGIESVEFLDKAPGWFTYELPDDLIGVGLKGKFRGQKQRWFAYRFTGEESEIRINPPPGGEKAEFDQWRWVDMNELVEMVVDFKRPLYRKIVQALEHLAK